MSEGNDPKVTAVRDLVSRRLNKRWERFAKEHPHLAASIEPMKLVDVTVERLAEDPEYRRAMETAGRDEAVLAAASQLVEIIDSALDRTLGL